MTRTGEQLLARFFFPLSFPAGFIRLARSSLFLIFHPLHSLIILIFHPLNKNLSPISLHLLFSPPLSIKIPSSPAAGCGEVRDLRRETELARGAGM